MTIFVLLATLSIPTARANSPAVTLPSTFNATTDFSTVSGISLSNYSSVQATVSVSGGTIRIVTTTGLSVPTGYSSSDWTSGSAREIAFSGTQANVNNALATLQYRASAFGATDTITVASFVAGAAYNSANGRFYEVVNNGSTISWENARCKAKYGATSTFNGTTESSGVASNSTVSNDRCTNTGSRRTFAGLNGYLATITSLDEHQFLRTRLTGTGWIGGADTDEEGTWRWMDGPEANQVFWVQGNANLIRRSTNTINGISQFNYWSDGEPNNSSNEDFAEFGFGSAGVGSSWNDCRNGCGRTQYVIEYGGDGGTLSGTSGTIAVRTAPAAPTSLSATAGARSAILSWTAPTSVGGTSITGYKVQYQVSGSGSWIDASTNTGSTSTNFTVTELTAGSSHTFRVAAINAAGVGTFSSSSSAITPTKATPTFASWSNVSKTFGDSTYIVTAPTVNGSIAGSFAYSSNATSVISVSGTTLTVVGAGSATITATFTPTDTTNFNSATTTHVVTVAKANQFITFGSLAPKTLGSGTVALSATASSDLAVSFTSSDNGICSVSGTTLTLVSAGTCTINADQAGNTNFNAATQVIRSFTISSALTIATPSSGLTGTYGSAFTPLTLSSSGGSGGNTYTLLSGTLPAGLSLNSSSGVISGTPSAAGSASIEIQVSDSNTATASTSSFTLSIDSRTITVTAADRSATYTGSPVSVSNSFSITAGSLAFTDSITSLTYTYTSIPAGSYSSTTAPTTAGSYTITPSAALFSPGNASNYAFSYETATLTISKATPTLSSFTVSSKTYGDADFSLTDPSVAGSLSGSFTYSSSNASVATISGDTVTVTGAGSSTITALFTPSDTTNYETATITASLSVSQASQASLSITTVSVAYGQSLSLQTSGGSGSGSITFAYVSGACTLSGSTLTPTAVGSCLITATQAADSNYLAQTTSNTTITITSGTPTATISFTSNTFTFGSVNQITVTTSVAGTVRFRANTKVIKSCKATATTLTAPFTATCNYRVSTRRPLTIRAILTPSDSGFTQKTSTSQTFLVGRRVGR